MIIVRWRDGLLSYGQEMDFTAVEIFTRAWLARNTETGEIWRSPELPRYCIWRWSQ